MVAIAFIAITLTVVMAFPLNVFPCRYTTLYLLRDTALARRCGLNVYAVDNSPADKRSERSSSISSLLLADSSQLVMASLPHDSQAEAMHMARTSRAATCPVHMRSGFGTGHVFSSISDTARPVLRSSSVSLYNPVNVALAAMPSAQERISDADHIRLDGYAGHEQIAPLLEQTASPTLSLNKFQHFVLTLAICGAGSFVIFVLCEPGDISLFCVSFGSCVSCAFYQRRISTYGRHKVSSAAYKNAHRSRNIESV